MSTLLLYLTGWTELTVAVDPAVYDRVCRGLAAGGVSYRTRAPFSGNSARSGPLLGSLGDRPQYQTQYNIFVKRRDLELAKSLLRQALSPQ